MQKGGHGTLLSTVLPGNETINQRRGNYNTVCNFVGKPPNCHKIIWNSTNGGFQTKNCIISGFFFSFSSPHHLPTPTKGNFVHETHHVTKYPFPGCWVYYMSLIPKQAPGRISHFCLCSHCSHMAHTSGRDLTMPPWVPASVSPWPQQR